MNKMEEIRTYIRELREINDLRNIFPNQIYRLIAELNINGEELKEFAANVLPTVYELFDDGKIKKDLFFLSILTNRNPEVLSLFLKYEQSTTILLCEDPASLFDVCFYKHRHWLLEVLDCDSNYFTSSPNIASKITVLKIFKLTNELHVNVEQIESLVNTLTYTDSAFVSKYVDVVKYLIDMTKFIKDLKENVDSSDIFGFLIGNSLLQTFSEYLDLSESQNWNCVSKKLTESSSDHSESQIFKSFTILLALIKCLHLSKNPRTTQKDEITDVIESIKDQLLQTNDNVLLIEILENIFALTFIRTSHFSDNVDEFFCGEPEIRLILSLLKSVFEEIRRKNSVARDSVEFKRFLDLNKYISDAFWRLEIITDVKVSTHKRGIMYYMLSTPEALINLCLKAGDLEKANQVVQIFGLEEGDLSRQINYTSKHVKLKADLKKPLGDNKKVVTIIKDHFDSCDALMSNTKEVPFGDQKSLDLMDLFLTSPNCQNLLDLIDSNQFGDENNYSAFCLKIVKIFEYDSSCPSQILTSPRNRLDFDSYKSDRERYEMLADAYDRFRDQIKSGGDVGTLNVNHVALKTFAQIEEICGQDAQVRYMQRLSNYLKTLSRLLFLERNNSDLVAKGREVSVFELLNKSRTKLVSELMYEKNLDGADFDYVFARLKLDLTYHMAAPSFPKINLNFERVTTSTETDHRSLLHKPRKDVINYIQKRNWLLAFILNKIHRIQDAKIDANEIRVKTLSNLIKLEDTRHLKRWFNNNDVITVLQQDFARQIDGLKDLDDSDLFDLISSIPENESRKHVDFDKIKDDVLCNIVRSKTIPDYYKYVIFISDPILRVETMLSDFQNWPGDFCVRVFKSELSRPDKIDEERGDALRNWCDKIGLYNQLTILYPHDFWYDIEKKCKNDLRKVLQDILSTTDIDVLVKFIDAHKPLEDLLLNITVNYIESLFDQNISLEKIKSLLHRLPGRQALDLNKTLLHRVRNLGQLEFVVHYLLDNATEDVEGLRNICVTLKMMTCFSTDEQEQHWSLIQEPLNILEVLLMNTKLEKLGQMIDVIKLNKFEDDVPLIEKIDALLRKYAEKSLEFRLVTHPRAVRTPDNKIMLSIDSLCLERKVFTMPEAVPVKNEWIDNNEVSECMCCQQVMFSMFNRRHHCRRCGRVVCWNCSVKRMQVASYGDILVRVCLDCFEQTSKRSNGPSSPVDVSASSINDEYWLLTDDVERNTIVRDEFAFENAPSVSLCLSILKYHSKNEDCPKFLLDQCDNILKLIQPVSAECTVEIDYSLIIKMLISLAVAAKVISNECMLQWGTSLADKILSQAELLGLLAEHGCLNLIPKSTQSQSPYVDAALLRRIRDKLLEQEEWNLALEVSTKAGLDNTAVFAIWGKTCLKAGNFHLARVKFQRCFDKTAYYETSEFSSINELDTSFEAGRYRYQLKSSTSDSSSKPFKNPPLLNEIVQILESTSTPINSRILTNLQTTKDLYTSTTSLTQSPNLPAHHETSICIINKLKNLSAIASGVYSFSETSAAAAAPHLEGIFYDECVYYLTKYGTHLSLCHFYIKHREFESALYHVVENQLNFDVFIEIYMACLKDGVITALYESIVKIDSTFDVWKDYLRCLCIHLEKQSMLNSLYQLQLFMGDFVRAAMTCIKFYSDGVNTFEELSNRVEFLHKARDHLKQGLEQEQWVEVSTVRGMSDSVSETYEEKALTNPALVMKMNSKDVDTHINTIVRQIDLVKFLSDCEKSGKPASALIPDLMWISNDKWSGKSTVVLPTLFGSIFEKMQLAILAIVASVRIEDGFKFANRLVQAYKLKPVKVYCGVGRQLAKDKRHSAIPQLVRCIHGSGGERDAVVIETCDEMLALAARTLGDNNATDGQIEDIIKYITDRNVKINSYIETKQLRSAFLVAAKFGRFSDVQRISREAELLNKHDVKRMCQKFLLTRQN